MGETKWPERFQLLPSAHSELAAAGVMGWDMGLVGQSIVVHPLGQEQGACHGQPQGSGAEALAQGARRWQCGGQASMFHEVLSLVVPPCLFLPDSCCGRGHSPVPDQVPGSPTPPGPLETRGPL